MGQYTDLVEHLPPKPEDPKAKENIRAIKMKIRNLSETELAEGLLKARDKKKAFEAQAKAAHWEKKAFEQLLLDHFEREGRNLCGLTSGETFSSHVKPYAHVVDKDAFREWCIENDMANALALNTRTMQALVNERLLKGAPELPGIDTYFESTIIVRKRVV